MPTITQPELTICPVTVGLPVVQAALSGYSDWAMRVIARRMGASYTLCEGMLEKYILDVSRGPKARR